MRHRKHFTREFKRKAVRLLEQGYRPGQLHQTFGYRIPAEYEGSRGDP
ncbi:MAG: hypothetical protein ACRD2L_01540 [Terriglobia bacterium]